MERMIRHAMRELGERRLVPSEAIAPHYQAWQRRALGEGTFDEDRALLGFLTDLFNAGLLSREGAAGVYSRVTQAVAQTEFDPFVGRHFGDYVAEEKIGEGAMGQVYRASHRTSLARNFVVKVLPPSEEEDDDGLRRFQREARLLAELDHPNIVRVLDAGQEGPSPFIVMDLVEGPTLRQLLAERKRLHWRDATRAVKQIAAALAAAHARKVVHRDVKPDNVLVGPGGVLKVIDFGVAKPIGGDTASLTAAGEILGTPAYMAPEQWGDQTVDPRADLFSLGVTYYFLVTGRLPFTGSTIAAVCVAVQTGRYKAVDEHVPSVPEPVAEVIDQLLERDRTYRTPSAAALLGDLDRVLRQRSPNVPRLEELDPEGEPVRIALVGAEAFTVGSDPVCDVELTDPGVALRHATIERAQERYTLRSHGPEQTCVDGRPVREIALRELDVVQFGGGPLFTFRLGNLGDPEQGRLGAQSSGRLRAIQAQELAPDTGPPLPVHGLLYTALEQVAHPRALAGCIEAIDPATLEARVARSLDVLRLTRLTPPQLAAVGAEARRLADGFVTRLPQRLFALTRENLGTSVEAWLAWWRARQPSLPRGVRPATAATVGRLVIIEDDGEREVPLTSGEAWTLGRQGTDVRLRDRSVSRRHAAVFRLSTRFGFEDLGSRFGVVCQGVRRATGILRDGDEFRLGHVRCVFSRGRQSSGDETTFVDQQAGEVDFHTFLALASLRAPAAAAALIRFLQPAPLEGAALREIGHLEDYAVLQQIVRAFLERMRGQARATLTALAGHDLGADPRAWTAWAREAHLGDQVAPVGWNEEAT